MGRVSIRKFLRDRYRLGHRSVVYNNFAVDCLMYSQAIVSVSRKFCFRESLLFLEMRAILLDKGNSEKEAVGDLD